MLTVKLLPQDEMVWKGECPFSLEEGRNPLYHQWRTYHAEEPIIVNTYNTGTGKTKAGLLRMLKRAQQRMQEGGLHPTRDNVLLIAPTNELLYQHARDAKAFCEQHHLPYRVIPLTRETLDKCPAQENLQEDWLRNEALDEWKRRGDKLGSYLRDPSVVDGNPTKRATIYVVNPDIFYYATYFCYNSFDRSSLFRAFFFLFNYVIIDELHYYTPKQLAAFLFFILYSKHNWLMDSPEKQRQFCILTATPRPQVRQYLQRVGVDIAWIRPDDEIPEQDLAFVEPVRALAPVELRIYSTEELHVEEQTGGLWQLVKQERQMIAGLMAKGMEGAIISSSLGTISRIYDALRQSISVETMGRITGVVKTRESRELAKERQLILATPTVDIGYNFERSQPKTRQNIDFLLFDALSGDEFIQRLGRAGRVLAKPEKDQESIVLVVLDPQSYRLLQAYDGQSIERVQCSKLAEEMPAKNDLYAYIRSAAIMEVLRPIRFIAQGLSNDAQESLYDFIQALQEVFGSSSSKRWTYKDVKWRIDAFDARHKHYSKLTTVPKEALRLLERSIATRREVVGEIDAQVKHCLTILSARLRDPDKKVPGPKGGPIEQTQWFVNDLREYYREAARFSFRESFQSPQALVYDPNCLLSEQEVQAYDALHIIRHYQLRLYESHSDWQRGTGQNAGEIVGNDVMVYAHLQALREEPLRIALKLAAEKDTREEWEQQFAYKMTVLYGLELALINDHHELPETIRQLFRSRFIPAYVVRNDPGMRTYIQLLQMRKRACLYPVTLEVSFGDGQTRPYCAILGTMALHVCAEMPYWAIERDFGKSMREDDGPIIC